MACIRSHLRQTDTGEEAVLGSRNFLLIVSSEKKHQDNFGVNCTCLCLRLAPPTEIMSTRPEMLNRRMLHGQGAWIRYRICTVIVGRVVCMGFSSPLLVVRFLILDVGAAQRNDLKLENFEKSGRVDVCKKYFNENWRLSFFRAYDVQ